MNLTSQDSTPPQRLQSALPSQAHELLAVERRERERVSSEQESLRFRESALEKELAATFAKEEEALSQEGMQTLQQFKQHELADFLKKENLETQQQAESVQNTGLSGVNKVAQTLVSVALSNEVLSRL